MPAKQRLLHHGEVGSDQVLDDPLRGNCSDVLISLMHALPAIAQGEGDRLGEVSLVGGRELFCPRRTSADKCALSGAERERRRSGGRRRSPKKGAARDGQLRDPYPLSAAKRAESPRGRRRIWLASNEIERNQLCGCKKQQGGGSGLFKRYRSGIERNNWIE
jgi:hypothetical protein